MAVCLADDEDDGEGWPVDEDITQPLGRRPPPSKSSQPSKKPTKKAAPAEAALPAAGLHRAGAERRAAAPPAALSASGIYRPLPGVERAVTGLHMPPLEKAQPGREWYAAFGGRARGPFSETELRYLAAQGRVRSSTLVWRPGFSSWRRVKGEGQPDDVDLSWLREVVRERKLQERLATDKAAQEHGIVRLHLDDFASPPKTPPPLPPDDASGRPPPVMLVGRRMPELAADRVFGAPQLGEPRLPAPLETAARTRRRRRLRALAAGALWTALALVLLAYTLPSLHLSLMPLVEVLGAGRL